MRYNLKNGSKSSMHSLSADSSTLPGLTEPPAIIKQSSTLSTTSQSSLSPKGASFMEKYALFLRE